MAEMTAEQAIAVLHNNQYQKHIGNGEYDYIHPLTDAEAKLIEKLIEQQAAEIEMLLQVYWAAKELDKFLRNNNMCFDIPLENALKKWEEQHD